MAWIAAASVTVAPASGFANPVGGDVVAGQASILDGGKQLDVNQVSNKAVIDWRGFDIAPDETTRFNQPDSNALTVNRVNANAPSVIGGRLTANGNLVVINPNGVLFGDTAQVDVNGIVATTADADNASLMKDGKLILNKPGKADAAIVNRGSISAKEAGLVGFVAPNVVNSGVIEAKLGRVNLASGDTATVDLYGDSLMEVAVSDNVKSQLVQNAGIIEADGGKIALTAAAGKEVVNSLIDAGGLLKAQSVKQRNGEIIISAEGSNAVKNNIAKDKGRKRGGSSVHVSGILDVSGRKSGERGGKVTVTGDNVALLGGSLIDASGDAGKSGTTAGKLLSDAREGSAGGDIRIGGDYLGQGETPTAKNLYVAPTAFILNDAITTGDAGRSIFWSDGTTQFYGNVFARALGGNGIDSITANAILSPSPSPSTGEGLSAGGFVETSGHAHLDAGGYVDLTAASGNKGTYFLDPTDITIYGNVASVFNSTNLTGNWSFDEGAGTTAGDSSGNARNGTLTDGPAWSANTAPTPQQNSKSLLFDGSNDRIQSIPAAPFEYDGTGSMTISLWLNRNNDTTANFFSKPWNGAGNYNYRMVLTGSGAVAVIFDGTSNSTISGSTALANNGWSLVTMTVNSAKGVSIYVDGVLDVSGTHTTTFTPPTNGNSLTSLVIGSLFPYGSGWGGNTGFSFDGLIDDVRVYNAALSANDVAELYGSRFTAAGIQKMSQTADVSIQATNNITLDLGGDTLTMANNRNLTLNAGNDILTASGGAITASGTGAISFTAGRDINLSNVSLAADANRTLTATRDVTLSATSSLTLPSISAASILVRTTGVSSDITIPVGKTLTASGTGNALTLAAGRNLVNSAGASALTTASGRWLTYTASDSGNQFGGLTADFTKYGCPYALCGLPATGNGFLYASSPGGSGGYGGGGTSQPVLDTTGPNPPITSLPVVTPTVPVTPPATAVPPPAIQPPPSAPPALAVMEIPSTVQIVSQNTVMALPPREFIGMRYVPLYEALSAPAPAAKDSAHGRRVQKSGYYYTAFETESADPSSSAEGVMMSIDPRLAKQFGLDADALDFWRRFTY